MVVHELLEVLRRWLRVGASPVFMHVQVFFAEINLKAKPANAIERPTIALDSMTIFVDCHP